MTDEDETVRDDHDAVFALEQVDLEDGPEALALHAEREPGEFDFVEHLEEGILDEDALGDVDAAVILEALDAAERRRG
jgi:hypothetical protein